MNNIQEEFLKLLSKSLWDREYKTEVELDKDVCEEALQQTVLPLLSNGKSAIQIISSNIQTIWEQSELGKILDGISYVVLKGTAASIYYSDPLRRTLGDIDLIVRREDFSEAYNRLKEAEYITTDPVDGNRRHVHFHKDRVIIELHRRFATLQTREQEQFLDEWIYEGIKAPVIERVQKYYFPRLEDTVNGLVLLDHINQHLEEGLGFRQILDWVMFVDKCLPDEKWNDFRKKSDQIGLTTLAKVSARLGQKYLGLREDNITWCQDADEETVKELVKYAFDCGNFGHKDSKNNTVVMVMTHGRGVKGFFRNLQRQGKANWKVLEKHGCLTPFAWIYQLGRYIRLGLRQNSFKDLRYNYKASKKRNRMLDKLEATRTAFKE